MSKKLTYEYVKEYIEGFEYKLLSNEYINNSTKLQVQCDKTHEPYNVPFKRFKRGDRCPECAGVKKYSYDYVKEYIEGFGYTLLSTEYISANSKIQVQCDKNHEPYYVSFWNFNNGIRCSECSRKKKLTYEYVKEYIESFGYKLLSKSYKNNKTKLKIRCNNHHESYMVAFKTFKYGKRCPHCYKIQYHEVKQYIESFDYKLLTPEHEYINTKHYILVQCDKDDHSPYLVKYNNFKGSSNRCPYCAEKRSQISQKLFKQIHENIPDNLDVYYYDSKHEYKVDTNRSYRMLDFYIPLLHKAIEFQGTFWHKGREFEDYKRELEIKEVYPELQLLYIDEQDYLDNPDTVIKKCIDFYND